MWEGWVLGRGGCWVDFGQHSVGWHRIRLDGKESASCYGAAYKLTRDSKKETCDAAWAGVKFVGCYLRWQHWH